MCSVKDDFSPANPSSKERSRIPEVLRSRRRKMDPQGSVMIMSTLGDYMRHGVRLEEKSCSKQHANHLQSSASSSKSNSLQGVPKRTNQVISSTARPCVSLQNGNQVTGKRYSTRQSGNKLFQCEICTGMFPSKLNLMQHKLSHRGQGSFLPQHNSPILQNHPQPSHIPRKSDHFNNESECINQSDDSNNESESINERDDSNNESESTNERDDTTEKGYGYDHRGKCLKDQKQLTRHQDDKKEKRFECETCQKKFSHRATLIIHNRVHTGEKPYMCEVCSKSFAYRGNLQAHRHIHSDEKPFACLLCDKEFSDRSSMKRHRRVHTKEKPYECEVCKKAFSVKKTLTNHLAMHTRTPSTESFRFICEVCDERFKYSTHLGKHLLIHAGE